MDYQDILLEKDGAVRVLTLNRPAYDNAFNLRMRGEFQAALREVQDDDDARVVIITGAGKVFSSGGAIDKDKGRLEGSRLSPLKQALELKYNYTPEILNLDKAVIAAINGPVEGTGLAVCLASDIRIAAKSARIIDHFQERGYMPGGGSTYTLPRIVGVGRAMELLLTGGAFTAEEAAQIGLVNKVVPDSQLMAEAKALAHKIARGSPTAIAMTKRVVYAGLSTDIYTHWKLETSALNTCFASQDHAEALRAVAEKRAPQFKGR